jgi:hypothetical protein
MECVEEGWIGGGLEREGVEKEWIGERELKEVK